MDTFSGREAFRFGWDAFKQRPWFLMGAVLAFLMTAFVVSWIGELADNGLDQFARLLFIPLLVANVFIEMALTKFWLEAHDRLDEVRLSSLWMPQLFFAYLVAQILVAALVLVGFVLFIVPGVILALMLMFTSLTLLDRGLGPIAAMKESRHITKGHRWQLLGFVLVVALMNLAGVIAFGVGLLVTIPITMLALVHVYRTLAHKAHEVLPADDTTPAVSQA